VALGALVSLATALALWTWVPSLRRL